MLARVTHLLPLTCIRRQRLLPSAGRVLVRAGQKVTTTDVIAEAKLEPGHLMVDIARGLGVTPDKADQLVTRKVGEYLAEGDVIAGPVGGIISRIVRAPKNGGIVAIGGGKVTLSLEGKVSELRAGMPGTVTELVADRGAVIENYGALFQGVWGNGRVDAGILTVAVESPTDELTPSRLDVSLRGGIVFGGYCGNAETLRTASELPVRGLILASMASHLIPLASQAAFPVMVLEGFGNLPVDAIVYKALTTNDKREVCLNAAVWDRFNGIRPELIIPLPAVNAIPEPRNSDVFAPGQVVRVIQSHMKGQTGVIDHLMPGLTSFPSGLHAPAAMVHLDNGDKAPWPLVNLEIIE